MWGCRDGIGVGVQGGEGKGGGGAENFSDKCTQIVSGIPALIPLS